MKRRFDYADIVRRYEAGSTQREIAEALGLTQPGVLYILRKSGVECRPTNVKGTQMGQQHHAWKGSQASYGALHDRVRRRRGTPSECEVCGTTQAKRYEWANMTGKYDDPMDYKRMCKSCHNRHDGIGKWPKRRRVIDAQGE
jgi:hypothetical protein